MLKNTKTKTAEKKQKNGKSVGSNGENNSPTKQNENEIVDVISESIDSPDEKDDQIKFENLSRKKFTPIRKYNGDEFGILFGEKILKNIEDADEKSVEPSCEKIVEIEVHKEHEFDEIVSLNEDSDDEKSIKSSYELSVQVEIHQEDGFGCELGEKVSPIQEPEDEDDKFGNFAGERAYQKD